MSGIIEQGSGTIRILTQACLTSVLEAMPLPPPPSAGPVLGRFLAPENSVKLLAMKQRRRATILTLSSVGLGVRSRRSVS